MINTREKSMSPLSPLVSVRHLKRICCLAKLLQRHPRHLLAVLGKACHGIGAVAPSIASLSCKQFTRVAVYRLSRYCCRYTEIAVLSIVCRVSEQCVVQQWQCDNVCLLSYMLKIASHHNNVELICQSGAGADSTWFYLTTICYFIHMHLVLIAASHSCWQIACSCRSIVACKASVCHTALNKYCLDSRLLRCYI